MLKLRRDLSRAVTLLEMVKRREKTKKENLNLTKDIFEKRYLLQAVCKSVKPMAINAFVIKVHCQ